MIDLTIYTLVLDFSSSRLWCFDGILVLSFSRDILFPDFKMYNNLFLFKQRECCGFWCHCSLAWDAWHRSCCSQGGAGRSCLWGRDNNWRFLWPGAACGEAQGPFRLSLVLHQPGCQEGRSWVGSSHNRLIWSEVDPISWRSTVLV